MPLMGAAENVSIMVHHGCDTEVSRRTPSVKNAALSMTAVSGVPFYLAEDRTHRILHSA
eukprot:gene10929-7585_t